MDEIELANIQLLHHFHYYIISKFNHAIGESSVSAGGVKSTPAHFYIHFYNLPESHTSEKS